MNVVNKIKNWLRNIVKQIRCGLKMPYTSTLITCMKKEKRKNEK